jgi:pimeloyl-ACP methyl ester carboxylesterase
MTPTDQKQLELSQGAIRYRDLGEGEPIVFVHGLLVDGRLWDGVAERLAAAGHRAIVPDWPMGSHEVPMSEDADLSPPGVARLIAEFLAALELDRVTLVGNDSGGAVSQIVATEHPERIGRLVLTNCDAYENFPPRMFRYLKLAARIPGAMGAMSQTMRLKANRRAPIAYGLLTKRRLDDDLLEDWVRPGIEDAAVRRDAAKFIGGSSPEQTLEAARKLSGFGAPTLFAWAPEDRFFPFEHAERLARTIPNSRIETIDDAKTFVSLDQPERLADAIGAFVRDTAAERAAART